jgi:prolyl 4-hydroxylase
MYVGHFDFARPLLEVVPSLYSAEECRAILARTGGVDWLAAQVNSAAGRKVDDRLRNNSTAVLHDEDIADTLWTRARPHLPPTMNVEWYTERETVRAVGVNLPLRVYRYQPGQHFGLHQDQSYRRADGARSLLTLLVYLDDDVDGGETDFPEQGRTIQPRTGDALWFQHMVLHAGKPVTRGVKHVLRTDVLFQP